MQSIVDDAYKQFIDIVANGRGLDIEKVKELADGRPYTAQQALDAKLIDSIGTWDDALEDLRKRIGNEKCAVTVFRYEGKESLVDMLLHNLTSSLIGTASFSMPLSY